MTTPPPPPHPPKHAKIGEQTTKKIIIFIWDPKVQSARVIRFDVYLIDSFTCTMLSAQFSTSICTFDESVQKKLQLCSAVQPEHMSKLFNNNKMLAEQNNAINVRPTKKCVMMLVATEKIRADWNWG